MQYTVLVVEDEHGIRDTVKIFLKNQGYNVITAENGKVALDALESNTVHLAIVDVMMPVMDGLTFVMNMRQKHDFPVIFLSAKSEDIDKITGLNLGADDYMTKPFQSMELIARVQSNLRRYQQILDLKNSTMEEASHILQVGGLELNQHNKELSVDGKSVRLTAKEYSILEMLMSAPGRVYSAEQIYEQVWGEEALSTETVMVHVRKLREKIEINPKKPDYLKVVWGIGYKIEQER